MRKILGTAIVLAGASLSLVFAHPASAGVIDWNFSFALSNVSP